MAIKLATLFILLSLTACGDSPWSDYVKENNLNPDLNKATSQCALLDINQIQWTQGPHLKTESEFKMTFKVAPTFKFEVELYMPSMGHGSVPTQIFENSPTQFTVKKVFFIMRGDWEIRLKRENDILCIYDLEI